jgi:hypothetical protein
MFAIIGEKVRFARNGDADMNNWRVFREITRFKWQDVIVFFFGAPGGLHILDSLPMDLEDIVSVRVAEIILTYRSFMQEYIWVPFSDFLSLFGVEIPLAYFEPLSGVFALLVMILSSVLSGRRESITDLGRRLVRYEANGEMDYDDGRAWFNIFTYPFVFPYLIIFTSSLAAMIDPENVGWSMFLIAIPILFGAAGMLGGIRGIAKFTRPGADGSTVRVGFKPYLFMSIFAGIPSILMVIGFVVYAGLPMTVWSAIVPSILLVWLLYLFLGLSYHVNWRSLPIMMLWVLIFSVI